MSGSLHTPAHRRLVDIIVALRKKAGLSQRGLAERLGREQNFVARVETGQRRLDLVEVIQVCRALDADAASVTAALVAEITALLPPSRRPAPKRGGTAVARGQAGSTTASKRQSRASSAARRRSGN